MSTSMWQDFLFIFLRLNNALLYVYTVLFLSLSFSFSFPSPFPFPSCHTQWYYSPLCAQGSLLALFHVGLMEGQVPCLLSFYLNYLSFLSLCSDGHVGYLCCQASVNNTVVNMVCKYLLGTCYLGVGVGHNWGSPGLLLALCSVLGHHVVCGLNQDQLHSRQAPSPLYWPFSPRIYVLFFMGVGEVVWVCLEGE